MQLDAVRQLGGQTFDHERGAEFNHLVSLCGDDFELLPRRNTLLETWPLEGCGRGKEKSAFVQRNSKAGGKLKVAD